ncbi:hypothetical protein GCM10028794_24340 [Silanimonas algicola]
MTVNLYLLNPRAELTQGERDLSDARMLYRAVNKRTRVPVRAEVSLQSEIA